MPRPRRLRKPSGGSRPDRRRQYASTRNSDWIDNAALPTAWLLHEQDVNETTLRGRRQRSRSRSARRRSQRSRSRRNRRFAGMRERERQCYVDVSTNTQPSIGLVAQASKESGLSKNQNFRTQAESNSSVVTLHRNPNFETNQTSDMDHNENKNIPAEADKQTETNSMESKKSRGTAGGSVPRTPSANSRKSIHGMDNAETDSDLQLGIQTPQPNQTSLPGKSIKGEPKFEELKPPHATSDDALLDC